MGIGDLRMWTIFDARYKKPIWIVLIVLIHVVIGLTVPRLFMKGPRTRATMMSLGMGAKSLVFLAYEIGTEYVKKLQRWRSYKANFILNALDILFWGAVAFLNFQANLQSCNGVGCYLGWAVVGVAAVVNQIYIFASIMCWREWKGLTGGHRPLHQEDGFEKTTSETSSIPMYTAAAKTAYDPAPLHQRSESDDQQHLVSAHMDDRSRGRDMSPYSHTDYSRREVGPFARDPSQHAYRDPRSQR